MKLSRLAETLIPSEIIKLAGEIKEKMAQGKKIYNFTIGDFDPKIFPIPDAFQKEIINAYLDHQTNYPAPNGIVELRKAVRRFLSDYAGIEYDADEILISAGGRPLIYAIYRAIVDKGEKVIYALPSWNNNHYTNFEEADAIEIETTPENDFMPTAEEIRPHVKEATLLALCSPLNPTGTIFKKEQLAAICDLVVEENKRRGDSAKPLYVLFDQIYWTLTFGGYEHVHPIALNPAMKDYTIYVDGMSKAFAATGVRVGWSMGPVRIINKMKALLSHIGAWCPMAEQAAAAKFLTNKTAIDSFLAHFKDEIRYRLDHISAGIKDLKQQGFPIDCIEPQGAIYLTVKIDLIGKTTATGHIISDTKEMTAYLLDEAHLALVPFNAFGTAEQSKWYRLSVGTCKKEEIPEMLSLLKTALDKLS